MLLLAIVTVVFFWRALLTDAVLLPTDVVLRLQPWRSYSHSLFPEFRRIYNPLLDPILLFFPWRVFAARVIGSGFIPLWNPDSFCGQPFLANASSAVLYPLNALHYLMAPERAYGYVAALHTFLAGTFTFLFLRTLALRPSASLLGSITFTFCGFLVVWTEYQTPVAATIWLPLALYCWERYMRSDGLRFALYAGAPLGMPLLGGHPQYAIYVLLAFVAYAAWRSGLAPARWVAAVAAVAVAVGLAAHQALPTAELGRYNHRSDGQPLKAVLDSGLPLKHLVTFLVPRFFGTDVDYNYWGGFNFVEYCGYLGVLPLVLVAVALWTRRNGHTRFFAGLAAVTLLMILGTPAYAPLYYLVPGFKQLANPARMLGVFSLAMACLAAFGANALSDLPAERGRGLRALLVGLLIATSAAISLVHTRSADRLADYARLVPGVQAYVAQAVAWYLGLALLAGVAVLAARGRPTLAWALPALAAADLFLFGMRLNPAGDPRMLFFRTPSLDYLSSRPAPFRVLAVPSASDDFLDAMVPNCNLAVGLAEVQGGDAMYPRRYRELAEFLETRQQGRPVRIGNGLTFSSPDTPGLDYLNVTYVLSARELSSKRLEHVASPDMHVYRNRLARPRAFLVHQARVLPTARVLATMAQEGFPLDRTAFLEEKPDGALQPVAGKETVRITGYRPGAVSLAVSASSPALLVLADQYFPGWRASVDGRPARAQVANYVMRAVAVGAGRHTVRFTYRPASFLLGLYLSLATVGLLTAVAAGSALARSGRRGCPPAPVR